MERITYWIMRLTGGRPMADDGFAFTDVVSGKPVRYFNDYFGRRWMAESAWARFRVEANGADK